MAANGLANAEGAVKSLSDLKRWVDSAPVGTTIPIEALGSVLASVEEKVEVAYRPTPAVPVSWRVLLWTVDSETRIGRDELLEAIGRTRSWLYRHTGPKAVSRIPHRRLDGELVFVVGEVRRWLRDREEIVMAGPMDGPLRHGSERGAA